MSPGERFASSTNMNFAELSVIPSFWSDCDELESSLGGPNVVIVDQEEIEPLRLFVYNRCISNRKLFNDVIMCGAAKINYYLGI